MKSVFIDSIDGYNRLYGLTTRHPLVAAVDLRECGSYANNIEIKSDLYGLFLKNTSYCSLKYGRKNYDFQAGTVVSMAPGQTVVMDIAPEEISLDVFGIVFHPDLIYGTTLADSIQRYNFFSYSELESLHLSEKEREKFLFYFNIIRDELEQPIDSHSAAVISTNIQLLLEHLQRFYDRQFTTRHKANSTVVRDFEKNLRHYFSSGTIRLTPNVALFAELASLSPGYFSDLIRKETGMGPKDMINLFLVAEAKKRLRTSADDISDIARGLGFEYPAHFTRLFKRLEGITPSEFRIKIN